MEAVRAEEDIDNQTIIGRLEVLLQVPSDRLVRRAKSDIEATRMGLTARWDRILAGYQNDYDKLTEWQVRLQTMKNEVEPMVTSLQEWIDSDTLNTLADFYQDMIERIQARKEQIRRNPMHASEEQEVETDEVLHPGGSRLKY